MEERKHGRDRFRHPLFGVVLRNEHLNIMYKEQFFPGVNDSSSELKPGELEAVEEPHKPESEEQNSVRRINRRDFTLDDYVREWDSHPEWRGLSREQARRGEEWPVNGLRSFYEFLWRFANRESKGDEEKRDEIIQQFFPEKYVGRKHYRLEDYTDEWSAHPEWHGFSTKQAGSAEGRASGLRAFYDSLLRFAQRESEGDEVRRRKVVQQFFPEKQVKRTQYRLEDYVNEWNAHPEWHGFSTEQIGSAEGRASGLGAFYASLLRFANRESKGDEAKRSEIMQQFFPEKQVKRAQYRLEDYVNEWNAHPEWHGLSTTQVASKEGTASGLGAFYASLKTFAQRESKGDEEKRREIIERFFPFRVDKIYANRGYALQYSVETILKIIGNKNLSIETPVKRIDNDQRAVKPDLMYEYADGERALIFDIKLQTTTIGIEKDKENYSAVLQNKYPRGGNLVFLCLNGPDFPSERLDDNDRVRVRYYHILDFLERLADNRRNKFLLRLISGNEEQEISQVPELTPEQIGKITEIADQLKVLQKVVSERSFSTEDLSLEDASEKTKEIRLQLSKLAKTKVTEENIAEIMSTDFKKLMDF